jgi:hypothetical protein
MIVVKMAKHMQVAATTPESITTQVPLFVGVSSQL